ncbi:MAG: hypothetical protein K2R98_14785 [Gemmataceae bacterium]|nr:hypothetical protein [Gemmataceae bacterium]
MKLSTGRIKLHSTMKTLHLHWQTIKPGWNDPVCQEFEENTLVPLAQEVASTLRAIDRLAQVFDKAQQELNAE